MLRRVPHSPSDLWTVRRAPCSITALPPNIIVCQPFDFPLSFVCMRVWQRQPLTCMYVRAFDGGTEERRPNSASLSALSRPPGRRYPPPKQRVRTPPHVPPMVNQKGRIFSGTRAPQIAGYNAQGNLVPPIKIPNTMMEPVDNVLRLQPSPVGLCKAYTML